jgi:outer membrane receptor protein involved in Fe transport
MGAKVSTRVHRFFLTSSALVGTCLLFGPGVGVGLAQTALPKIEVEKPKQAAKRAPAPKKQAARRPAGPPPGRPAAAPSGPTPQERAVQATAAKANAFDRARSNLYTTVGTTSDTKTHDLIDALPGGTVEPVEKVLLQAPGVSQDSAASGLLHVRNDHANVQYRINGVMLPDGITGFGSIFETGLIGSITLVTGALPAEFGLRTVGLVDITTRSDAFNNSGRAGIYFGSRGTVTPSIEYGGTFGATCTAAATPSAKALPSTMDCFSGVQYFFTGRYLRTTEGIENPIPALNAIHDLSTQDKGFAYMSAFVDPTTRVSLIAGTSINYFQIPNNPGQPVGVVGNPPVTNVLGITNFNSAGLNENQYEVTHYGVLALQRSTGDFDGQLSYFTRYNYLHFTPDPIGDLLLNGVASDITRQSYTNGIQGDAAYVVDPAHTIRAGFTVSAEKTFVGNTSLVEPCTICDGSDNGPPESITDDVSKTGYLMGVYLQDAWKIADKLTINGGLRFDQMYQYIDANQLSPRLSLTYNPVDGTTFHAGYARYFTPPVLVEAAPANISAFNNTTGAPPAGQGNSPVLPERSNYYDVGVDQKIGFNCSSLTAKDCTLLEIGVDAYYKVATDLIDNGNFGQALVLSAFNYAEGINKGVEFSMKFKSGNFQAYGNLAVAEQKATDVVSNQYLFDNTTPLADLGGLTLFQYLQTHWIFTDHTQIVTASAGGVYQFCGRPASAGETFGVPWGGDGTSLCGIRLSGTMIAGSGLRSGDANIDHEPPYAQFNTSIAREFLLPDDPKPVTVRFDVVNVFDTVYQLRSGTGIGVFAPQYGPRRGYFLGIAKKF